MAPGEIQVLFNVNGVPFTGTSGIAKNICIGEGGGSNHQDAYNNVYLGYLAGFRNIDGDDNIFIGYYAGNRNRYGTNNIAIGRNAGNDALYQFDDNDDNVIVLGNNDHTDAYIKPSWNVVSDERDKYVLGNLDKGLEFVNSLNPVEFQWKNRETQEITDTQTRYGFLAQDVLGLEGETSVIVNASDEDHLKLREAMIVPVLVNALKELSEKYDALAAQFEDLQNSLG
jgi:hypothetical protein